VSEREWTHSFWGRIYLFPERRLTRLGFSDPEAVELAGLHTRNFM
jgi:hypothetical protein